MKDISSTLTIGLVILVLALNNAHVLDSGPAYFMIVVLALHYYGIYKIPRN